MKMVLFYIDNEIFLICFVNENINFQTNIQLCVAYYKLNDREKSYKYHLKAKKINPDDPIIKYNDLFFTNFK